MKLTLWEERVFATMKLSAIKRLLVIALLLLGLIPATARMLPSFGMLASADKATAIVQGTLDAAGNLTVRKY